ncbi:uncharacterized protein LOC123976001 isoform X2 [Micropterus dolomieu]|uniref:uncharacterized protein LOC123976001 isoform X2 n=1 Tax=Micropterus dolomieu TaxID=147949 RepID=UPI001E8D5816|nr:uncharacterized protein LOC123976001 isoform X2 [Micropterus dolomieu]
MAGVRVELLVVLTAALLVSVEGWARIKKVQRTNVYESRQRSEPRSVTLPDYSRQDDDGEDAVLEDSLLQVEGATTSGNFYNFANHGDQIDAVDSSPRTWRRGTDGGFQMEFDNIPSRSHTSSTSQRQTGIDVVCSDVGFQITLPTGSLSEVKVVGSKDLLSVMDAPESCGYEVNPLTNTLAVPFTGCYVKRNDLYSLQLLYVNEFDQTQVATASCERSLKLDPGMLPRSSGPSSPTLKHIDPISVRPQRPTCTQRPQLPGSPQGPQLPGWPQLPGSPQGPQLPGWPQLPGSPQGPQLPGWPQLPGSPQGPQLPGWPQLPGSPQGPQLPGWPQLPGSPQGPQLPGWPQLPGSPQGPQLPGWPQLPGSPQGPQLPGSPQGPQLPGSPQGPQLPGSPQGPQLPGSPQGPQLPGSPQGPQLPGSPQGPQLPGSPQGPQLPGSPQGPQLPGSPQGPQLPGSPQGPQLPGSPQGPQLPGSPQGPQLPGSPQGPQLPGSPQGPQLPGSPPCRQLPGSPPCRQRPGLPQGPQLPGSPQGPQRPPCRQRPGSPQGPQRPPCRQGPAPPTLPKTHGCGIPTGEQVTCGQSGISSSDCKMMGCCVGSSTSACYYPMDECTVDQHFVFAIRANSASIPVDPTKLVITGSTNCKPVIVNDKVAIFKFNVTECGVHAYEVGETMIYLAEVQTVVQSLTLQYGVITTRDPLRFMVECRYSKAGVALQSLASAGYMVKTPSSSLPSAVLSNGLYAVDLRIAKDQTYSSYLPTNNRPLRLLLGNPVYLELRLISPKPDAVILVNYCVAYPRSARNALVLIYEGCPNLYGPNMSILKICDSSNRHQRRFVVEAFQFMVQKTNDYLDEEIYFMCSTEVCFEADGPCEQQCFDGKAP